MRAGLVRRAADWPWSSAEAHLAGSDAAHLLAWEEWRERWSPGGWGEALDAGIEDAALMDRIREAIRTGRPAGSEEFVRRAELRLGRRLALAKRGRKPKAAGAKLGIM